MTDVVFIAYLCNYGGIESLLIRMSKWLKDRGESVFILADKDRKINDKLVAELENSDAKIRLISFRGKDNSLADVRSFFHNQNIMCITFSYPGIILADAIFKNSENVNIIFYDPHQYGLMMDYWSSNKQIKLILRIASNYLARRLYNNHQIIFMDKLCKNRTINEFKLTEKYKDDVVFLPMIIESFNERKILEKVEKHNFNILTICRMTFPFKGYVLGLIDLFEVLVKKGLSITMTIVGSGDGDQRVRERVDKLDKVVRDKIILIPGLTYEQLAECFDRAMLYIGMGTTVIDAVNQGVPALPIGSYTYDCRGYSFFYVNPENLGGLHGENEIIELVEEIYAMDVDEYIDLCRKDHDSLISIYNIDVAGNALLSYRNCKHGIFNKLERIIVSVGKRYIK